MRLIDADALYEKTAEWEARALAIVEKLNSKPLCEMDVNEITEWRKWSCVLNERSAFKHDVADAPTIEPEQQWIPVTERLPEDNYWINVTVLDESGDGSSMYASVGWYLSDGTWIVDNEPMYDDGSIRVIAWMPMPAPWKGGAE